MNATRDDLIEILRDVIQTDEHGTAPVGRRLAAGLAALAEQCPGDTEVRALALDAIGALSEPD